MGKTVTRSDLGEVIMQNIGFSRSESKTLVDQVLAAICDGLARDRMVKISGFGSFVVNEKARRIGRNPKTGVAASIEPRSVAKFRSSNSLKQKINAGLG